MALWGTEQRLSELFGDGVPELKVTRRMLVFRYRSAEHFLEIFRTYYGPVLKTLPRSTPPARLAWPAI